MALFPPDPIHVLSETQGWNRPAQASMPRPPRPQKASGARVGGIFAMMLEPYPCIQHESEIAEQVPLVVQPEPQQPTTRPRGRRAEERLASQAVP